MLFYGFADIAYETPRLHCRCPDVETLFGDAHEALLFRRCATDDEHTRRIAEKAVFDGRYVYVDDVALFQYFVFRWNAVADYLIDARADAFRKAFIIERCRDSPVLGRIVVDQFVDLCRRHSCTNFAFHQIQYARIDLT